MNLLSSNIDNSEGALRNAIALLNAVIDDVSRAQSYTEGLQNILKSVCDITGWDIGEAWEPDSPKNDLAFSQAWYTSEPELYEFREISRQYRFSYGNGLPGIAWKQKTPVWIPDVKKDADFHRAKEATIFGLSAGVAIPVIVDDEVINVMVFFLKEKKDEDKDFINLISGIAKQLGGLFLRKKTEDQVTRLSYEYEKVFNGTQSAMFLLEVCSDGHYRYVRTNKAYERMSGYSHNDTFGKTPYDLFDKKGAEDIINHYEQCLNKGRSYQYELSIKHKGIWRIIEAELNPIFEDDTVKYIVGSSTDITEKKQIMDELIVAKDKAEDGDRLKTAFLNNISHEVRTPLNGILGFGQLLSQKGLTDNQKKAYLKSMNQSSRRLIDTIDKIVDISMIFSDTLEINLKKINPSHILYELHNQLHKKSTEKGIELEISIPENIPIPCVSSDAELLKKALIHLIDNALKFTDKGSVTIGLSTRENELVFFIKDTGCGIKKEYLDMLYEPFSQEDSTITRGYEGSGLGLSIAAGIIKKIGGRIHAESEKHRGSTFFISLPFSESKTDKNNMASTSITSDAPVLTNESTNDMSEPSEPVTEESKVLSKCSILLADDDEMALFLLETLIEDIDARIISVTNGKEAIDAFRTNPNICLVIMDIKMPVMDGIEASRQMKSIRQDVPIIAVTAHAMSGDEQRIRDAGCDDYIAKPLSGKILLDKIQALKPQLLEQ
jgi:PAS domain S-box-containing protein